MLSRFFKNPFKSRLLDVRYYAEQVSGADLRRELEQLEAPLAHRIIYTLREIEGLHGPYFSLRDVVEIHTLLGRLSDHGLDEARSDCRHVAEYMIERANRRAQRRPARRPTLTPAPAVAK